MKLKWLPRSVCKSAASSSRKRDVEPPIFDFMTTLVRSGFIFHHICAPRGVDPNKVMPHPVWLELR
jgi:hypothetical protein